MDISGQKLTHREAWEHFYTKWKELSPAERQAMPGGLARHVEQAHQDSAGRRKDGRGKTLWLGPKRVAKILLAASAAMPERFAYTHHKAEEWFELA